MHISNILDRNMIIWAFYLVTNAFFRHAKNKQTPWPESASELYRSSDLHFSAKLVTNFAGRGVSRSERGGSPTAVISVF
jgi:hypothetical protein